MAFTVSNVQTGMVFPGMKVYLADWTGVVGDAPGTITLGGGRVYLAVFRQEDTGSPQEEPDSAVSVTAGVITLTVYNHQTVNSGRLIVIYS